MRERKKTIIFFLIMVILVVNFGIGCKEKQSPNAMRTEWPENVIMYEVNIR